MWGTPYPSIGKVAARFGFFGVPPHDTRQKTFCLRKPLKGFDFCKLFLYSLSMIVVTTISLYYTKVVGSLD